MIIFAALRRRLVKTSSINGFTLMEIMVVVLIAGLLLGSSLVCFRMFAQQRLGVAAALVEEDIRWVQQMNMSGDKVYSLLFDPAADRYLITTGFGLAAVKVVRLPQGVELVATNFVSGTLGFGTSGKPYPRGGHLVLADRWGGFRYVIVQTITGRVRVDVVPP